MKKFLLLAAVAAVVLSSCSNDAEIGNPADKKEIGFRTLIDKGTDTRAAITNSDNILNFTVTGWWNENGGESGDMGLADLNAVADGKYLFNGYDISRRESNDWSYAPPRYWPSQGEVYFFAYSPAASRNVTAGIANYVSPSAFTLPTVGGTRLAYTVPDPLETKTQEEDFLLAATGPLFDVTVKLNFVHALSRVRFFARTTHPEVNYTIHSVELVNLYKSAQINLEEIPTDGALDYSSTLIGWDNHASLSKDNKKDNVSPDMAAAALQLTGDFKSLTGETNGLMVMPQETTLYDGDPAIPADGTGEFALKIVYSAYHGGIWYEKNTTRYFAVKDPASADPTNPDPLTFEMGRQYNFNLTFGDEVGDAIAFEIDIPQDWDNAVPVPPIELPNYATTQYFLDPGMITAVLAAGDGNGNGNGDGFLTYEEMVEITSIELPDGVTDLTGLDLLPKLTEIGFAPGGYSQSAFPFVPSVNTLVTKVSLKNATSMTNIMEIENFPNLTEIVFDSDLNFNTMVPEMLKVTTLTLTSNFPRASLETRDISTLLPNVETLNFGPHDLNLSGFAKLKYLGFSGIGPTAQTQFNIALRAGTAKSDLKLESEDAPGNPEGWYYFIKKGAITDGDPVGYVYVGTIGVGQISKVLHYTNFIFNNP